MEGHTDGFPNLTAHVYFVFSLLPAFLSSSFTNHQQRMLKSRITKSIKKVGKKCEECKIQRESSVVVSTLSLEIPIIRYSDVLCFDCRVFFVLSSFLTVLFLMAAHIF